MPFKITITETKTVKKTTRDYGIVGTKEVPRDQAYFSHDKSEPRTRIEEVRDYLPPIEKEIEVTTDILVQHVEHLDLPAVIKAINKLD